MARSNTTTKIDGITYKIRQVGGLDGLRVKAQALRTLGGPLASVFAQGGSVASFLDADLDDEAERGGVTAAIREAAASVDPDGLVTLMRLMCFGNVSAKDSDGDWLDVDDAESYAEVVSRSSNPMHDVNLLAQLLMANLLPTSAGDRTNQQEESPAADLQ
ncbi:MAG: hypothetical protein GY926_19675 [bacterium]|nr:hypothetical protein [bacterium]